MTNNSHGQQQRCLRVLVTPCELQLVVRLAAEVSSSSEDLLLRPTLLLKDEASHMTAASVDSEPSVQDPQRCCSTACPLQQRCGSKRIKTASKTQACSAGQTSGSDSNESYQQKGKTLSKARLSQHEARPLQILPSIISNQEDSPDASDGSESGDDDPQCTNQHCSIQADGTAPTQKAPTTSSMTKQQAPCQRHLGQRKPRLTKPFEHLEINPSLAGQDYYCKGDYKSSTVKASKSTANTSGDSKSLKKKAKKSKLQQGAVIATNAVSENAKSDEGKGRQNLIREFPGHLAAVAPTNSGAMVASDSKHQWKQQSKATAKPCQKRHPEPEFTPSGASSRDDYSVSSNEDTDSPAEQRQEQQQRACAANPQYPMPVQRPSVVSDASKLRKLKKSVEHLAINPSLAGQDHYCKGDYKSSTVKASKSTANASRDSKSVEKKAKKSKLQQGAVIANDSVSENVKSDEGKDRQNSIKKFPGQSAAVARTNSGATAANDSKHQWKQQSKATVKPCQMSHPEPEFTPSGASSRDDYSVSSNEDTDSPAEQRQEQQQRACAANPQYPMPVQRPSVVSDASKLHAKRQLHGQLHQQRSDKIVKETMGTAHTFRLRRNENGNLAVRIDSNNNRPPEPFKRRRATSRRPPVASTGRLRSDLSSSQSDSSQQESTPDWSDKIDATATTSGSSCSEY